MFLLYNGLYQEIDIPKNYNDQQILDALENRKCFVGQKIGDFEVVSVEYDWGLRKQINIATCVRCGEKKEIPNLRDFVRGKGVRQTCPCRYKKKKTFVSVGDTCRAAIGQVIGGFRLVDYQTGKGACVECLECGKQKWISAKRFLAGEEVCNHKVVRDYSDPKYIGMRVGNLTVLSREGNMFRFQCDCGAEVLQRPTDVFRIENNKTCGREECRYHQETLKAGAIIRKRGVAFEKECAAIMEEQGYPTQMTPESGDYGVDFFAVVEGERVAFQCKRLKVASFVRAVQEVYAGGRYYDCCKFVVVSPSGFSYSAELMASKLGVQLETDIKNFHLKSLIENKIDTQRICTYARRTLAWEIDGVVKPAQQWCDEYGISRNTVMGRLKKGMTIQSALTTPKHAGGPGSIGININGVCKPLTEWCDLYGISPQLYNYRVKYSKLSPIEALTKEKCQKKKQGGCAWEPILFFS